MDVQMIAPPSESLQFGSYLLAEGRLTRAEYQIATTLQQRRPFLHLGEVIVLMGLLTEGELEQLLTRFNREARLGSLLVARRRITTAQLAAALELQVDREAPIGEILVELGYIDETDLAEALELQGAMPAGGSDLFDKFDRDTQVNFFKQAEDDGLYPYFQPLEAAETPRSVLHGREIILLAANSYLGLSNDPEVIEASLAATRRYGVGTSGSPLLNGTMDLHVALERDMAEFMGKEACALFSTGFQTNLGVIAGLVGRGDVVLIDSIAHASLHDGARLSFGDVRRFNHNNLAHLEELLKGAGSRGKLVVIDGVYSMDGDMADLPGIVRLCKAYGAKLLLDDAHGFGVLGMRGRGTAEYFRLLHEVDIITLTFSKSLGTIGGCVLGDRRVVDYLKHRSRPFIFSATLPPGTVAATHTALRRLATDPSLRHRLSRNVEFLRQGFLEMGLTLGQSQSQILPVQIGDEQLALRMGHGLLQEGVMVGTVVRPGVPPGQARLRVSAMASHSLEDLRAALDAFYRVGNRLGLLPRTPIATEVVIPAQPVHGEEIACSK